MIKSKESKESHTKEKLYNTNKSPELKESQSKEPSLTIMPSKPKSNTFPNKSNKPSSNMNQSKESGKEFNISQLKLKLFTTPKEITTSQVKVDTSKPDTLKEVNKVDILPLPPLTNKVPLTFHPKAESELKPTKLDTSQLEDQLSDKDNHTLLVDKLNMFKDLLILLPTLPEDKPMSLEAVESEEKTSTELLKLEVT